ncbi:amino acid adenylation domain protein [Methylocella silvestris BL2]|uniref:Amino acid adenylation domain protein n=1 Tax=Methylocella silvestris (strain DSM 15510 / CIP 108128 / LMG 27833 / NCIMB 13906 / BL2) TaxID=395965 RepID=B8ESD5_METSB|nr:non-ribosomal peptide synthetase [Methylocella silvestris]ACK49825.1 amino acid adenylation domain protein [Methylocella silvestris BL2]
MTSVDKRQPVQPHLASGELVFSCSSVQQPFWFMDALEPGNPASNIALRWELEGRIGAATIERAFQAIIDRHEILRTRFIDEDGEPFQIVAPHFDFQLGVVDLTAVPQARRIDEAMALVRAEARASFDIETLPLIRATLLQLAPDHAFLALTVHHLVFDGWSISIIAREFGAFAEAIDSGRPAVLPELPLQYGDYCRWEAACAAAGVFEASLDYWRRQLSGAAYFEVPADRDRSAAKARGGEIAAILLPAALGEKIGGIGRTRKVTLFVFGCAVITLLLRRYTGKSEILLATQSVGRDDVDLENLIGPFVNNLVLRFVADDDPSFERWLARVNDTVQDALHHSKTPFHKLVEILNPTRDQTRPALASVNFTVFRDVVHRTRYGDFYLTGHPSASTGALYDLNFFMAHWPNGWRIAVEYNSELFDKSTVEHLLAGFAAAFEFAFATPEAPLSAFALPAIEAAPAADASPVDRLAQPVDILFAERAAAAGAAAAVVEGMRTLSYRDLDRRSTQCARRLQALGVRPGDRVGLLMQRSIEAIVVMLGVLKAGAAYVPFDPASPKDHLAFMVEDCRPALAFADRDSLAAAPDDAHFAPLEALLNDASRESGAPLESCNGPDSLAYVMYTSGSTGRPKGVMIPHRGIARLAIGQNYAALAPDEVILHVAPLAFDASTFEIWSALLNGARVAIICDPRPTLDEICETISRQGVTLTFLTTGLFHLLVDERLAGLRPLRRILVGGEVMSAPHLEKALAGLPQTEIVNIYGPTENTTFTSFYAARRGGRAAGPVPIGRAIAHTEILILGPDMTPVADGEAGQLACAGAGVALGYLNRPELTAEKFIDDPTGAFTGRLYLTGDMARRGADGEILFLGRTDRQVKINGKRVELDEIEAVLRADPRLADALVERLDDSPARPLVAYLKLAATAGANASCAAAIVEALRAKLPPHMIPSAAVLMKEFPLTPNGKVDRKALPRPGAAAAPEPELPATAAWSKMELIAGAVWREVLKRDDINLSTNFFDLGGHSMLATRIAARLSRKLGLKIPVSSLFKTPTLKAFAAYLASLDDWRTVTIQPLGDKTPIVAINDPMLYYNVARELGAERPIFNVALFDAANPQSPPDRALEDIAAEYVELLRKMQPRGPYILAGYCVAGVIAYEAARQLREQGDEVPLLILADSWAPGYVANLSWPRRLLSELAFRRHVLQRQFRDMRKGEMSFGEILASYRLVRKSRILDLAVALHILKEKPVGRNDGQDQWFLRHLNAARRGYCVKETPSDVALLQSEIILTPRMDKGMGWTQHVKGRLSLHRIPGWHGDMFGQIGARAIAEALHPLLQRVDAAQPKKPPPTEKRGVLLCALLLSPEILITEMIEALRFFENGWSIVA